MLSTNEPTVRIHPKKGRSMFSGLEKEIIKQRHEIYTANTKYDSLSIFPSSECSFKNFRQKKESNTQYLLTSGK